MRRLLLALLALAFAAWAANIKLYLKDGGYHLVSEYKVEAGRVRFYSLERGDWEEMPLELVDLERTRSEAASRQAEMEKDAKVLSEEEKVERDLRKEVTKIPQDPGVYWMEGGETKILKEAEAAVHTRKGRSILAKLSPIPAVSGKGTLEVQGEHSANVFTNPEQEFYFQLAKTERFGIVRLTPKGTVRIVENLTFMPITKEVVEEPEMVDIFRTQLSDDGEGLYKIWPKEPLAPGEYAVVEYTEGKLNIQVHDFAIKAK
ncbi:MAG TPA: hypothetical protein VE959_26560 [Bryobacteraceae bacterium]|nr:hypothetical protein [Bryobacteraceae bacterium]